MFSPEKRAFFVEALGEGRVRELEERLPALGKELEVMGVAFKDLIYDVLNFGDAEAVRLFDVFLGIAGNVIHAHDLTTPEKLALLKQAVGDLASRIAGAGGKTTADPARRYVDDLLAAKRPAESKASKALRESGRPGADYAADVLEGRVVRG